MRTIFGFERRCNFRCEGCLFEWPPFEILLVSSTWNTSLMALLTFWFRFVAFQALGFACYTSYKIIPRQPSRPPYQTHDKGMPNFADIPLRILDCLGLTIPVFFFGAAVEDLGRGGLRFGTGGGSGAGLMTGEDRKAVGDGMVMVSIVITSCTGTWKIPALNISPESRAVAARRY
jgi:hypothetical protein